MKPIIKLAALLVVGTLFTECKTTGSANQDEMNDTESTQENNGSSGNSMQADSTDAVPQDQNRTARRNGTATDTTSAIPAQGR
jgi:hypothetical protein